MNCCQGIEELFDEKYVRGELQQYRTKGAQKTTRMLIAALKAEEVQGLSLLDIGGGVGAIQHELLAAGLKEATDVDASQSYLKAARAEAERRGIADRVNFRHGNFVDLAAQVTPADIVTLDRVICCFPDMDKLVSLSAARARKYYGVVYPRDVWWVKIGATIMNIYFRLKSSKYRTFLHPNREVEALINNSGLKPRFYRQTLVWQVAIYAR
ncbi:MAG: methyltransferase domain-containing protein [Anaerolineaceae bacterium]|nr:methyltransferase domain-containing protein [Anaerolineaceae bacterium]